MFQSSRQEQIVPFVIAFEHLKGRKQKLEHGVGIFRSEYVTCNFIVFRTFFR